MKKSTLSILHIVIAILAFAFGVSLKGQAYPNANTPLEMVPYRLVPSDDLQCNIEIVNPHSASEMFIIDERYYYLIRLPNTGELWHRPYLRSDWR